MTSDTNTPPTLEEAEGDLANMDGNLANSLRSIHATIQARAAGIVTPALEPPKVAQAPAPITEPEATAPAAPAPMPEPAQDAAISAALETLKARERQQAKARAEGRRALSPVKRRMIESSVKIAATLPDDVLFQHSVFCQTVLPYRDPGPEVRKWERQQGNIRLQITAGEVDDKQRQQFVPVGLPYGPVARLILCHLNTEALKTRSRTVEVDGSMTSFVARLHGFSPDGRQIRKFKDQLTRLSAALIRLAADCDTHAVQVDTKIITAFDLWEERYENERFLFSQQIILSADYFESLQAHAVPLDERAVAALAHSAMGLDVYMWLAQRLHRVGPQRGQFIPWTALHEQFGQGYKQLKFFRRDFKTTLNQVLTQYPEARVKTDKGGMLIGHSPPPVPQRRVILLPKSTKG